MNRRTRVSEESFDITFDDNFVRKSEQIHVETYILESDVSLPGSPNPQVIHEVDFDSLFAPIEKPLDSESRSKPS